MTRLLMALAVLCACGNILADSGEHRRAKYLTKPLTLLLMMAALATGEVYSESERWAVLLALFLSMLGDIALMLERDLFLWGLVSFLAAHLVYVAVFTAQGTVLGSSLALLPFLLVAGGVVGLLWRHVPPRLRLPVLLYVSAIAAMGWAAGGRYEAELNGRVSAALVLGGAMLFLVSDSVLAWRRFRSDFYGAQPIVLSTYFSAQVAFTLAMLRQF